jgi:hypothetical protein
MKRSEINRALRELEEMASKYRFALPPFCRFTPEQWSKNGDPAASSLDQPLIPDKPPLLARLRQTNGAMGQGTGTSLRRSLPDCT